MFDTHGVYQPGGGDRFADLADTMDTELDEWKPREYTTSPGTPGGLPDGWTVLARMVGGVAGADLFLVRRTKGGFVIVQHREMEPGRGNTQLYWVGVTLASLFSNVCHSATEETSVVLQDWLRPLVADLFDDSDPAEAAERVLFALGGPLKTIPARDR